MIRFRAVALAASISALPCVGPSLSRAEGTQARLAGCTFGAERRGIAEGMRPAFNAEFQRFLDRMFGSMGQDCPAVWNYWTLRNLMRFLLEHPGYSPNLTLPERVTLAGFQEVFASRSRGSSSERDWALPAYYGGPRFPSLEYPAASAPPFSVHIRNSDEKNARLVVDRFGVLAVELPKQVRFSGSWIEVTVGRGQAAVHVKAHSESRGVAEELARWLRAADPALRIDVGFDHDRPSENRWLLKIAR